MTQAEDLLQELVEQLENGEAAETIALGLPAEEREVVQLIAVMREVPFPEEDEAVMAAQEARLLAAAKDQFPVVTRPSANDKPVTAVILARLQAWVNLLRSRRELAFGLASALVIALLVVGWFSWSRGQNGPVPTNEDTVVEESIDEDAPIIAGAESGDQANAAVVADVGGETPAGAATRGPTVYLPSITSSLNFNAQTAVIEDIQGVVELQTGPDMWTAVNRDSTMTAGQRLRTGALSQATLTFYDGSQAYLGANTEISLDELNALRPEEGFRTVVMTQWVGDSDHSVQFRNDGGSRYEVNTPSGSGVARGTKFHVLVTPDALARYTVTEGRVDVTGMNRIVSVTAGQLTTLIEGEAPDDPAFSVSGEGEVTATGAVWTIAGQTFQTHERTIIVGNPQIGDLVRVDGHLLADGSRVADRIFLLRRAIVNRFSMTGEVEAVGDAWTIAGQTILVNEQTAVDPDIDVGATVRVEGVILTGGAMQAEQIALVEDVPGFPFQFSGVVQTVGSESWMISGQLVAIDDQTVLDDAIAAGDVVEVRGWVLDNGTWLASKITRQTGHLPTFEFTGSVQSIDPWQVAGLDFETRSWTVIAPGVQIGDQVRVRGSILSDGTRVADSITSLTEMLPNTVVFIGTVASMDPWVVNGLQLAVTGDTQILGDMTVGTLVRVEAMLLSDGTWTVLSIQPLYPQFGLGCLVLSSPVTAVNPNFIQIKHWKVDIKRDGRIKIHGDIKANQVITVPLCTGWDGSIIVIGDILIIYQPPVIIINDGGGNNGVPPGCKITNKGSIKCSRKSDK